MNLPEKRKKRRRKRKKKTFRSNCAETGKGPFTYYVTRLGEGVVEFVTVCYVGEGGGLNLCYVTKRKCQRTERHERKKNERNDCFSRKIEGIQGEDFFKVLLLVSLIATNLVEGNC